jgi:hypothetical protein
MNAGPTFVGRPLDPEELKRLERIYDAARWITGRSKHDPAAARLAAMAIRFYQLGVQDDEALLEKVVKTHCELVKN